MDTLRKTVKFFPFKEDFCWLLWGFWCLFQLKITLSHFQDLNFGVSSRESGLPWGFSGKECACQCRRPGFDPWVRKIPWRRKWQPTPVFLPGKPHGQRSLAGYSPCDRTDSDTTEKLGMHTHTQCDIYAWIHSLYQQHLDHIQDVTGVCPVSSLDFQGTARLPRGYIRWHITLSLSLMSW